MGSLSTNHGSYAGESVPTVNVPAFSSGSWSGVQASEAGALPSVVGASLLDSLASALALVLDPSEALSGLQRITIISAVPFILVMVGMCVALTKDLYRDPITLRKRLSESVVERSVRVAVDQHQGETFDIVTLPTDTTAPASATPGEYARVHTKASD